MINVISNRFPNLSQDDYTKCMNFISTKCSEYYFCSYLSLTNGDVDDAISFFKFDEKLRSLLLRYILRFENQIKTDFACEIETTTGCNSFWSNGNYYLNSAKAPKSNGKPSDFTFLRRKITKWIHNAGLSLSGGYSNFVAVHACSFGSFIDLIKFIDIQYKTQFIANYTSFLPITNNNFSLSFSTLTTYLTCVKKLRDKCAHGAYIITSSFDAFLAPHNRLIQQPLIPDPNKNYSMLEATLNFLFQYSNCKTEFKRRLKRLLVNNNALLSKYNGRHSFSNNPLQNLF